MTEHLSDNDIQNVFMMFAKSMGFDDFKIRPQNDDYAGLFFLKKNDDETWSFETGTYVIDHRNGLVNIVEIDCSSEDECKSLMRKMLEKMLEMSEAGWTVEVLGCSSPYKAEVLLPAHSNIESIMMQLDLSCIQN